MVNGPGEARETDIGLTGGGSGKHMVYLKGVTDHTVQDADMLDHIVKLVEQRAAEIEAERRQRCPGRGVSRHQGGDPVAVRAAMAAGIIMTFTMMDAAMKGLSLAIGAYSAMLWRTAAGTVMLTCRGC